MVGRPTQVLELRLQSMNCDLSKFSEWCDLWEMKFNSNCSHGLQLQSMNCDLSKFSEGCDLWEMKFNSIKTKTMIVSLSCII